MATIIPTPTGFIAGDPAPTPGAREHECCWCYGTGLEYDDILGADAICGGCSGTGYEACVNPKRTEHPATTDATPSAGDTAGAETSPHSAPAPTCCASCGDDEHATAEHSSPLDAFPDDFEGSS